MQKEIQYQCPHLKLFPGSRAYYMYVWKENVIYCLSISSQHFFLYNNCSFPSNQSKNVWRFNHQGLFKTKFSISVLIWSFFPDPGLIICTFEKKMWYIAWVFLLNISFFIIIVRSPQINQKMSGGLTTKVYLI